MRSLLLPFCFFISCWADPKVEMYMDWESGAKGQELFAPAGNRKFEELSLFSKLRYALEQKGTTIQSWELARHRPELLKWSGVHSWSDFICWLFPKKSEVEETTWLFWSLGLHLRELDLSRVAREKKVLMIFEPPTVQPEGYDPKMWAQFRKVLTWDDDLVDGKKFFKYYYPVLRRQVAERIPFHEKKFCAMFSSRLSSKHPKQLYREREKIIRFFEDKVGEFDLYGKFWEKRKFKNWKGRVEDKIGILKGYKFSICYENMRDIRGYVTEKIFDCFAARVVPIYWGASNISDYVDSRAFIDRRKFGNDEELYAFLRGITEEEYEAYLRYGEEYVNSSRARLFSEENFVETVVAHLTEKPSS